LTHLTPTDEQRAILEARGRILKINARAGTGKTTTLRMLAEKFSDQRILYLVFNRRTSTGPIGPRHQLNPAGL
jgi:F-box protein, helicase, 18